MKAPKQLVRLLSIEIDPSCFGFSFLRSMIGLKTFITILTNQIQKENKSNLDTRIFPRFEQVTCFYFEFSLANDDVLFALIGDWDYFGFCFLTFSWEICLFYCPRRSWLLIISIIFQSVVIQITRSARTRLWMKVSVPNLPGGGEGGREFVCHL